MSEDSKELLEELSSPAVDKSAEGVEFNPEEIEKEALEQAEKAADDPIAQAATLYGLYMPKFKQGVKKLSSRARARLLMALVEYPLNERQYKHTSKEERELMAIGSAVLEAKFLMILATMHQSPELNKAMDPNVGLTEDEVRDILKENPELVEEKSENEKLDDGSGEDS